jgi:hypothetical protein
MKICTVCSRTYVDDAYKFCSGDGKFLSVSYEPELDSVMRIHPFPRVFKTGALVLANVDESVVAINIAEQYPLVRNADELYNCTRGFWRLKKESAEKANYAFAVYKGVVKEVYEIDCWEPAKVQTGQISLSKLNSRTVETSAAVSFGRYQFVGKIAPGSIRNKYLERHIPIVHGQSPILYFNCQ